MTTLLVCTVGGHLVALHELLPRFTGADLTDRVWITHDTAQSRSLLAGERVEWVPYIDERDALGVLGALPHARRMMAEHRPAAVISTGSAIAVAYLTMARAHRVPAYFIETAAAVDRNTRTGRILKRVPGVKLFAQSRPLERHGFRFGGSTLDGWEAVRRREPQPPERLVVTVGTSTRFGFRRLVERLAAVIPPGVDVLWQTGCTDVSGLAIEARPWVDGAELEAAMREADLVVAHAGGGTAVSCFKTGHRPVVVARRAAAGDFGDDHQLQLAGDLRRRGLAEVTTVEELSWPVLVASTGMAVRRAAAPPPFVLEGPA